MQPLGLRTAEAPPDLHHVDRVLRRLGEVTRGASAGGLAEVTGRTQGLPDHRGRLLDVQVGKNTHVYTKSSSLWKCHALFISPIAKTLVKMSATSRFLVHKTKCIFY